MGRPSCDQVRQVLTASACAFERVSEGEAGWLLFHLDVWGEAALVADVRGVKAVPTLDHILTRATGTRHENRV